MLKTYLKNDLKKNKLSSICIGVFIMVSTILLTASVIVFSNLYSGIDQLMAICEAPSFVQMHKGSLEVKHVESFADDYEGVLDMQVVIFANIQSEDFLINGISLRKNVQDNGLVRQNKRFDFLVNEYNRRIEPQNGSIYIPACYYKDGSIEIGDQVTLYDKDFKVAGYLRDALMNSSLASSKRFLVSDEDFDYIARRSVLEYLIEFELEEEVDISHFEAAFIGNGVGLNGPTLTRDIFYVLNALNDGLVVAILFLLSIFVLLIAFLCIRFTLLAQLEEDYREIGVMKVIGIPNRVIEKTYLIKYLTITFMSIFFGYLITLMLKNKIIYSILINFGMPNLSVGMQVLGLLAPIIIVLIVVFFIHRILIEIYRLSPLEALYPHNLLKENRVVGKITLHKASILTTGNFMMFKEMIYRKSLYITLISVMTIGLLIMIIPTSLYKTISSEDFLTYMGVGGSDFRIDIQSKNQDEKVLNEMTTFLERDPQVKKYTVLITQSYPLLDEIHKGKQLKIETGNHSIFPVRYSLGRMPEKDNEIALSVIAHKSLGLNLNDAIQIERQGEIHELIICGIYTDITNGGKTAKACFVDHQKEAIWSVIYGDVVDVGSLDSIIENYETRFPSTQVSNLDFFVKDTFGPMRKVVGNVVIISVIISMGIVFLVVLLFFRLLLIKNSLDIAILKIIGRTSQSIKVQYMKNAALSVLLGLAIAVLLYTAVGNTIIRLVLERYGVSSFRLESAYVLNYMVYPIFFMLSVQFAVIMSLGVIDKKSIAEAIKE